MARNDASKYREFYVHGTAAYNRQVAPSEIVRDEPIYVPPRKRIEETVAANTQALTKQSLSPMVMLGFVIAVAMLVFCLIARIEFTTVSAEAAELQSQLNQLTEDNSRLTIKYESALNLAEVEDYAVNQSRLWKPYISVYLPSLVVLYEMPVFCFFLRIARLRVKCNHQFLRPHQQ